MIRPDHPEPVVNSGPTRGEYFLGLLNINKGRLFIDDP